MASRFLENLCTPDLQFILRFYQYIELHRERQIVKETNYELEQIWNDEVVTRVDTSLRGLTTLKISLRYPVSRPRFEQTQSRIRSQSIPATSTCSVASCYLGTGLLCIFTNNLVTQVFFLQCQFALNPPFHFFCTSRCSLNIADLYLQVRFLAKLVLFS